MSSRRTFLKLLGGGVVLAAGGSALWAATRDPAGARKAWAVDRTGEPDSRKRVLSYAVLAPNPHNRQPWIADLSTPDTIVLTCDPDRHLPQTDPFDRQITIGLGCFIELLSLAAAESGFRTDIKLFPDGESHPVLDERPVARLRLVPDHRVVRDPLFASLLERRTNRLDFDTALRVPSEALAAIANAAHGVRADFTNDRDRVTALRALAWQGMTLEMSTYHTAKESVDLTRIGRSEIEANPDGISIAGPMMEALALTGIMSRKAMLDTGSTTFGQQMKFMKPGFDTAMAFLWLTTPANSRADQIAAGRAYVRANLAATALGVGMQPFGQTLQEFSEMRPYFERMRGALGIAGPETLQMFARRGYGSAPAPSPRWPLQTRIRTT